MNTFYWYDFFSYSKMLFSNSNSKAYKRDTIQNLELF